MPYDLAFQLGPMTVAVTGVPDEVPRDALRIDVDLHPRGEREECFEAMFLGLGGTETFTEIRPTDEFSCKVQVSDGAAKTELTMYTTGISRNATERLLAKLSMREEEFRRQQLLQRAERLDEQVEEFRADGDVETAGNLHSRASELRREADEIGSA